MIPSAFLLFLQVILCGKVISLNFARVVKLPNIHTLWFKIRHLALGRTSGKRHSSRYNRTRTCHRAKCFRTNTRTGSSWYTSVKLSNCLDCPWIILKGASKKVKYASSSWLWLRLWQWLWVNVEVHQVVWKNCNRLFLFGLACHIKNINLLLFWLDFSCWFLLSNVACLNFSFNFYLLFL